LKEFNEDPTVKAGKKNQFHKYGSWAQRLCYGASKARGNPQCAAPSTDGKCGKEAYGLGASGKGAKYCPRSGKEKSYCNKDGDCVSESSDDDQKWKGYWVGDYCKGKCQKRANTMHANGLSFECGPKSKGKRTCFFGIGTHWVCRRPDNNDKTQAGWCVMQKDFEAESKGKTGLLEFEKYGSWADALCRDNKPKKK